MKVIEILPNSVTHSIFSLPLILGASLMLVSGAPSAEEHPPGDQTPQPGISVDPSEGSGLDQDDLERQNINPQPKPRTGTNGRERPFRGTTPHMDKGTTSGTELPRPDTTFDTEKMNRGTAPDTENINKDTVGPGGDNMMRDAIPGGSGLNR